MEEKERKIMSKKQFAVLGVGRFGQATARKLSQMGHDVLAVDRNEEAVDTVADEVTHAVIADITDEDAMGDLGLSNFDAVIVTLGHDLQASVLAVVLAKEAGAKYVVAKAMDDLQVKILGKIGADRIVMPERDMGVRLAQRLAAKNVTDFMELSDDYVFTELKLPEKWAGKNLRQLDVRARYGANVVAVRSAEGKLNVSPAADDPLQSGDFLIMLAPKTMLEKLDAIG